MRQFSRWHSCRSFSIPNTNTNTSARRYDHCDEQPGKAIFVTPEDALAPQLSSREKSVLRCLIKGNSNKCIARKMDIAEGTVKVHVKAILRKIRVHNRTQAAIWGQPRVTDTSGKQQLPACNLRCEQAASKTGHGDPRNQANRGIGAFKLD